MREVHSANQRHEIGRTRPKLDDNGNSYLIVRDRVKARRLAPGNQRRGVRPNCAICSVHFQRVPLRVAARDQHGKRNRENQRIDEGKHLRVVDMKRNEKK